MSKKYLNKFENLSKNYLEKKYLSNTDSARNHKIFGSPSFITKNEVFWGDDRMEDAIKWADK